MKKKVNLLIISFILFGLVGCANESSSQQLPNTTSVLVESAAVAETESAESAVELTEVEPFEPDYQPEQPREDIDGVPVYGLGEEFEYQEFSLKFTGNFYWSSGRNQSTNLEEVDIICLEVEYTNNGNEPYTITSYAVTCYDPDGYQLPSFIISHEGTFYDIWDIEPGVTATAVVPVVYKGSGEYTIEFGITKPQAIIKFQAPDKFE